MEPMRNEHPLPGFLDQVRKLADASGAVLVVDEISAAFRLNTGGLHLLQGLVPDMAVFSKALANGYPMAAVIGKTRVMEAAERSFISSTHWSERIGPAAALATVKKHRAQDVGPHLVAIGEAVQTGWKALFQKHGIQARVTGLPPMSHFVFEHEEAPALKALFVQSMLEQGILASTHFYAMWAHRDDHVEAYLYAADQAFQKLSWAVGTGEIGSLLRGRPARDGFKRYN
jgi:glutamate-1-semialdehyde 2,1-aminomutase